MTVCVRSIRRNVYVSCDKMQEVKVAYLNDLRNTSAMTLAKKRFYGAGIKTPASFLSCSKKPLDERVSLFLGWKKMGFEYN